MVDKRRQHERETQPLDLPSLVQVACDSEPVRGLELVVGACAQCVRRDRCLPGGQGDETYDNVPVAQRRLSRGESVYRVGDACTSIFAIRSGFLKSRVISGDDREQIMEFSMAGDLVGLDGLADGRYATEAVAMEDTEVCALSPGRLVEASAYRSAVRDRLLLLFGQGLRRQQHLLRLRSQAKADARVAGFLIEQSERFAERGYAADDFLLRASRAEIGSYLGLSLESVSRAMGNLSKNGVIVLDRRRIQIADIVALKACAGAQ